MPSIHLHHLAELHDKFQREKYPAIPEYARTKKKYKIETANGLTAAIIDFLNYSGHQAERISSSGRYIDERVEVTDVLGTRKMIGSGKWIPGQMTKGSADISSIIRTNNGTIIPWKIEIKIGKDRQSNAQKKYQAAIERVGGVYDLIKDFDEFYERYTHLMQGTGQMKMGI